VRNGTHGGAIFRFDLPLSELAEEEQQKELSPWPARRVTGLKPGEPEYRILVVEDHKENRLLMESLGLVVKEAADGEAGVAQWEAWQPHLIWMDMRMPGMDGYEATRRIKATEQGQRTKVIALTASAFEEDRHKVIAAGCDDFVRKPFREEEVCEMLERHLGVGFTYEEAGVAEGIDQHSATPLTADDLAVLPGELLTALHRASMQADDEAVRGLLAQIDEEHANLVQDLAALVRDFRFADVLALTDPSGRDS